MKIIISLVVIGLLLGNASAQNLKKAYRFIDEKRYDDAMKLFSKATSKQKDQIVARFGIAKLFCVKDYEGYSPDKALKNYKFIDRLYPKSDPVVLKELEDEFDIMGRTIDSLKILIVRSACNDAIASDSIAILKNYVQIFGRESSMYKRRASKHLHILAFEKAKKEHTYQSYHSFIRNYPKAKQYKEAKNLYEQERKKFYERYSYDGEFITLMELEVMHPLFQYPDSIRVRDKKRARMAEDLKLYESINKNNEFIFDLMLKTDKYDKFIKKAAPNALSFVALQRLIEFKVQRKNWVGALKIVDKYCPIFGSKDQRIIDLTEILQRVEDTIHINSISNIINSKGDESSPVMTADDKQLFLCGKHRDNNLGYEDIFVSNKTNGKWSEPELIDGINTPKGNEAPLSVSADGNFLLLFSNSDIFYSIKTSSGWSKRMPFPLINTPDWEADAMLTASGKSMIFVSDRKGGIGFDHKINEIYHGSSNGNSDLYVTIQTDSGWAKPINLGETINTPFCDRAPYLHPDMKTLYFSSDGHGGLGRLDIYKSTRLSDTSWTQWSKPINLGRQINTAGDDWGYKISTDGEIGYFAAKGDKDYNIFQFDVLDLYKPDKVVTITGRLLNSEKKPVEAVIVWEDLETGKDIGNAKTDANTGKYFMALPYGKKYGYFVLHEDYFPISKNIDLTTITDTVEIEEHIEMFTINELIQNKTSITLNNIFFDKNKHELRHETYPELNRFSQILMEIDSMNVEISGHTDNTGDKNYNIELSKKRAEAVKAYIVKRGYNAEFLITKGCGNNQPIGNNNTTRGKEINRRIEFRILGDVVKND